MAATSSPKRRRLETYFHLAGMHEPADRVRPSARRPGRRAADEDGEEDASETQAEEETSASTSDSVATDG